MGRGTSKAGKGSSASKTTISGVTSVTIGDITIDLSDTPLVYGDNDSGVSGNARAAVEAWEEKRGKNKIEYNISFDQNGNAVGDEVRGGKTSVKVPISGLQAGMIHTHIHPRGGEDEKGLLGGTFSDKDLRNFAGFPLSTYRAKAGEGTYSITKGSNFDKQGFKAYVSDTYSKHDAVLSSAMKQVRENFKNSGYNWDQYNKDFNKAFNTFLVAVHNDLLAGQKKYGYNYTLERRK